ncbi:MAG TPA: ATP-binding protein, partial [Burkholderiaceae bacterium]|nr:ATP-binding protein [Burkholderiaceae bacterium]
IDAIVRQFVEFAQPSDAEPVERVDVGALIGSLAAGYQRADAGDSPQMTLEIEPDVGWIGQPTVLARILANLLENARRYGRTPGEPRAEVRVGARRDGRWLVLTVRDRGPGVPASQLPRLARPFTRLDTERSHHGGSGLGLAIVARLARRYGGQLQLDLPPDGGLSVQVRLQDAG